MADLARRTLEKAIKAQRFIDTTKLILHKQIGEVNIHQKSLLLFSYSEGMKQSMI